MIYQGERTKNIAFPLGGIGSGCISLTGNGELNDWEIFNRPNKNTRNGYSHFAVKANFNGKQVVKILHGDTNENYIGTHIDRIHTGFGFGPRENSLEGRISPVGNCVLFGHESKGCIEALGGPS